MIRIFLIDHALDDPRSVRRVLSASNAGNFRLKAAIAYREIMAGFQNQQHDVCVIDSVVDNGFRLFAQARSLGYEGPIILVTSNNADEVLRAMRSGVADCLIREDLNAVRIEQSICYVVEQGRGAALQKQRERRHLALLENADEVVYTHDLEGNFTSMNRAGEQLLGYSQDEILKMNLFACFIPEHLELVRRMIGKTIDARTKTVEGVDLISKHGNQVPVQIATHLIQHQGTTLELQGVIRTSFPFDAIPYSRHNRDYLVSTSDLSRSFPAAIRTPRSQLSIA
jgi:PAS domain S-box-containing protein